MVNDSDTLKLKRKTTMFMSSCLLPIGRVICADLLPCNPSHSCLFYCSFPSCSSDLVSSLCQGNRLPEERPETMLKIEKRTCKSVSPSKPPSSRMPQNVLETPRTYRSLASRGCITLLAHLKKIVNIEGSYNKNRFECSLKGVPKDTLSVLICT